MNGGSCKNMVEFVDKIEYVDVDKLKVDGINPNFVPSDIQKAIDDHIEDKFYGAILVNRDNWVVDGKHRFDSLKRKGVKKIPVIYGDWDKDQSKIEMVRFNRERGRLTANELSAVLSDLDYTLPELSEATSISEFELSSLMLLDDLNEKFEDHTQTNHLMVSWGSVTNAVTKVSRKLGNVREIYTFSRGGLIPARLIADRCNCDTIYVDQEPPEGAVIVDDVWDTGKTLEKYSHCKRVVLFAKKGVPDDVIFAEYFDRFLIFQWETTEYKDLLKA